MCVAFRTSKDPYQTHPPLQLGDSCGLVMLSSNVTDVIALYVVCVCSRLITDCQRRNGGYRKESKFLHSMWIGIGVRLRQCFHVGVQLFSLTAFSVEDTKLTIEAQTWCSMSLCKGDGLSFLSIIQISLS